MFEFNFNPTTRQLRQFGGICLLAVPFVAWFWSGDVVVVAWAAVAGVALCALGFAVPTLLRPVFVGLIVVTMPIGLVVGEAAMLLLYFGLFLPMAIMLRIIGRDSLQRRPRKSGNTFWQKRKSAASVRNYYHQF